MTVEDAVMQMNLLGDELLVFTDSTSGRISVLYRRKDGNYGLIETGPSCDGSIEPAAGPLIRATSRHEGHRLPSA